MKVWIIFFLTGSLLIGGCTGSRQLAGLRQYDADQMREHFEDGQFGMLAAMINELPRAGRQRDVLLLSVAQLNCLAYDPTFGVWLDSLSAEYVQSSTSARFLIGLNQWLSGWSEPRQWGSRECGLFRPNSAHRRVMTAWCDGLRGHSRVALVQELAELNELPEAATRTEAGFVISIVRSEIGFDPFRIDFDGIEKAAQKAVHRNS